MQRFSVIQAMEVAPADPVAEWAAPGGETGLEEPMWQLGLGGGPEAYPERPDEPNCIYYLRTAFCGYGDRCRFNHPRDRGKSGRIGAYVMFDEDHRCCDYEIEILKSRQWELLELVEVSTRNVLANQSVSWTYQLLGEKECSYYVKTGQCKFGVTCKFHHPQLAGIPMPAPGPGSFTASAAMPTPAMYPTGPSPSHQSSQQYGVIQGNWQVARPSMLHGSYVPGSYGPMIFPPGVVPVPGWTPYSAPVSPAASPSTQQTIGAGPVYGITQLSPSAAAYTGPYLSITSSAGPSSSIQKEQAFPERPGQPECQYYLRNGDCKFGATCKYHHPPEWSASRANYILSPMGLPLRPGAPLCSHYAQNGVCKFGPSCKFDHPMRSLSYSPSASSLTDMPVAPYPVGSTIAILAPSSSSSDLRPELLSGFSKNPLSSQMSSLSSSSASVGSVFSNTEALPQSSVQQSGQGSVSSSGGSSASPGGEAHTSS
ncbi:hypothetical protein SASPL_103729 [Salvia splendens]|uniref:C3H1-type domain-containing protein n=1 Tax=Salvia splendens TaxID=180675 RepID=A0A8X8YLG9_SALSN|nr:hypothetical protein SASPL_103729 [Salvia splendens]